jgi:DNA invertase Pin-like site-specific DNA recombinase
MSDNDEIRAIGLCRVSTVKQSNEGSSLEAQDERVRKASEYLDAKLVRLWSVSVSSRKGKNLKRKDLHEMLDYAKSDKKIRYIIVDEPDRFMRDFEVYYYWKTRFRSEAGAKLVYAKKPHLANEESIYALMEEMMDVFRAEASNQERINKSTPNMIARVKLGYYPGRPKPGYEHTDIRGLYAPKHPQWDLLRDAFISVLNGLPVKDAVANLASNGYRTDGGKPIDTYKFKQLMKDPYYAGIIAMANWEVNPNGLHKPMLTPDQHKELVSIADGIVYKPRKQFNAEFPLSKIMECSDCISENKEHPKIVGFTHSNGKGNTYKRYKCRGCGKMILQEELHAKLNDVLSRLSISESREAEFLSALRAVWEQDSASIVLRTTALNRRLEQLKDEKNKAVRSALNSSFSEDAIKGTLDAIDKDIQEVNDDLEAINKIEQDFIEFVEFSINFIVTLPI